MSLTFGTDESPWLQRADWAAKQSTGQATRQAIVWWIIPGLVAPFTLLFTYVGIAGLFAFKNSVREDLVLGVTALFSLGFEGLLVTLAMRESLRLWKYGNPKLKLDTVPVPLGGVLRGELALGAAAPVTSKFTLSLYCLSYYQKSMDGNVRDKIVLWQNEKVVTPLADGRVPVSFLIPRDGSETTNGILWRLRVSSSSGGTGVPFRDQYEIPVFQVPLTPEDEREAKVAQAESQSDLEAYHQPANSRIHVNGLPDGKTEFFFEAGRAPGRAILLVAMALSMWGISLVAIFHPHSSHNQLPGWLPSVLFGVGIVLFLAAANTLWGTRRVVIGAGEMMITNALGFIPMGLTTIPASDVVSIKSEAKYTATWGTVYNSLVVKCQDGTAIAGSLITDTKESEWLALQMFQRLQK